MADAQFDTCAWIPRLRSLALRGLPAMYRPRDHRFVFRLRRDGDTTIQRGVSRRYTAIALIGLAHEKPDTVADVLREDSPETVITSLLDELPAVRNLGDIALTLWAARALGHPGAHTAVRRLADIFSEAADPYTVEVAWGLAALCQEHDGQNGHQLRDELARALLSTFEPESGFFRHRLARTGGLRDHVACFADLVYPIQALSHYHRISGDEASLSTAIRCAERICESLGPDGQWWWHYDVRTGRVIEGYPVYAVHQDAMAPMALFALADAGGPLHREPIERGLHWLAAAPELDGGTLIDEPAAVIWRKVARHEPRKCVRGAQAVVSRIHPSLRVPGTDSVFPPGAIDDECRPYHLGWLLHAWPQVRAGHWAAKPGLN